MYHLISLLSTNELVMQAYPTHVEDQLQILGFDRDVLHRKESGKLFVRFR